MNLERRPKSRWSILGTMKMWPLVVGDSIQEDIAWRKPWRAKLGERDHNTDLPTNEDLDQLLKSVRYNQEVDIEKSGGKMLRTHCKTLEVAGADRHRSGMRPSLGLRAKHCMPTPLLKPSVP